MKVPRSCFALFFLIILIAPLAFALEVPIIRIPIDPGTEAFRSAPGTFPLRMGAANDLAGLAVDLVGTLGDYVVGKAEAKMFGRADELVAEAFKKLEAGPVRFAETEGLFRAIRVRGLVANPELLLRPLVRDVLDSSWRQLQAKALVKGKNIAWLMKLGASAPLTDVLVSFLSLPSYDSAMLAARLEWQFRNLLLELNSIFAEQFEEIGKKDPGSISAEERDIIKVYLGLHFFMRHYEKPNTEFLKELREYLASNEKLLVFLLDEKKGKPILGLAEELALSLDRIVSSETPVSEKIRILSGFIIRIAEMAAGPAGDESLVYLRAGGELLSAYLGRDWSAFLAGLDGLFERALAGSGEAPGVGKTLRLLSLLVHYGALRLDAPNSDSAEKASAYLLEALDSLVTRTLAKGEVRVDFGGDLGGAASWSWAAAGLSEGSMASPLVLDLGLQVSFPFDEKRGLFLQLNPLALGEYLRFEEDFALSTDFDFRSVFAPSLYFGYFFDAPDPFYLALRAGRAPLDRGPELPAQWFIGLSVGVRVGIFSF